MIGRHQCADSGSREQLRDVADLNRDGKPDLVMVDDIGDMVANPGDVLTLLNSYIAGGNADRVPVQALGN